MEAERKLTVKRYDFLLGSIYFTSDDAYQNCLVFSPMLN